MITYFKTVTPFFYKAVFLSVLICGTSCSKEEVEDTQTTDNETPDVYLGQKKIDLKNAESSVYKGLTYYIKNVHSGRVLDLSNFGNNGVTNVHQWECYGTSNQQWKVEDFDNYARLQCKANYKYLEVSGGSSSNKANIKVNSKSNDTRQKFTLVRRIANSKQFYIKNMKSNKVLDVSNYSKSNGGNIWQYQQFTGNNNNQLWEFFRAADY